MLNSNSAMSDQHVEEREESQQIKKKPKKKRKEATLTIGSCGIEKEKSSKVTCGTKGVNYDKLVETSGLDESIKSLKIKEVLNHISL